MATRPLPSFLLKSVKDHGTEVTNRITSIYMRIYRKTFRLLPVCSYALDLNTLTSGMGVRMEFDSLPSGPLASLYSEVNQLECSDRPLDGPCQSSVEKESTTFKINFWDRTVIKFNFKDNRLVGLFISLSLPLVIFLSWLLLTLVNFWVFYDVSFRSEWVLLFLLSLVPFYRAAQTSYYDVLSLLVIHGILDATAGTVLYHVDPHISPLWTSVFFDFFLFTNTIGSLQGFCLGTWFYVLVFTYVNYSLKGQLASSGLPWLLSIHAIGHAAYLGLGELLVQVILLRNRNFSDPLFGLDKSEMIHKFRYLGLSGKLEAVTSSSEELMDRGTAVKFPKRRQPLSQKRVSTKLKSTSDPKNQLHDSLVLRPSVGEIVDSFDICIAEVGPNSIVLQWAVPLNFLYLLAKCSAFIKEFDERDRGLSSLTSSLSVTDLDNSLSEGEAMRRLDITLRVNGSIWTHWTINKEYSAITMTNLHPHTNHTISMSVIGFRSAPTYVTTLPVELKYAVGFGDEIVTFENKVKRLVVLEESVIEERKLKREEGTTVKKLRRNHAQQELYFTQHIHQLDHSIERVKQDEEKVIQSIQAMQQSIQTILERNQKFTEDQVALSHQIGILEPQIITINYQASCLQAALTEAREYPRKLEVTFQSDVSILMKERNRVLSQSGKLEKSIQHLNKMGIPQVQSKILDLHSQLLLTQEETCQTRNRGLEIQSFKSHFLSGEALPGWPSSDVTDPHFTALTSSLHQEDPDFMANLTSNLARLSNEVVEAQSNVISYREAVESETEFVGRLEAERVRLVTLLNDHCLN